jgi:hypothetical protein
MQRVKREYLITFDRPCHKWYTLWLKMHNSTERVFAHSERQAIKRFRRNCARKIWKIKSVVCI